MNLKQGNMFTDSRANVILVTTNSMKRRDGAVVMGRGAALEATRRWGDFAYLLGTQIDAGSVYGVRILKPRLHLFPFSMGAFQVKIHWRDEAQIWIIRYSAAKLDDIASAYSDSIFAVNFPGIGNGRLPRESVLPHLQRLPDNVEVWER